MIPEGAGPTFLLIVVLMGQIAILVILKRLKR